MKKLEAEKQSEEAGTLERFDVLIKLFAKVSNETSGLIQEKMGSLDEKTLPINIERLAESLGIRIVEDDLNLANTRVENQLICEWEPREQMLHIDKTVDLFTRRYAVAYAIGCYCLRKNNTQELEMDDHVQYGLPLLSTRKEELLADIYAIFLCVPIKVFFKEFSGYIENIRKTERFPVSINEWLGELSSKAQIPYFNIAKGYQYLSIAAYEHYDENIKDKEARKQMENHVDLFM
mgnify:CR=1 FL=1